MILLSPSSFVVPGGPHRSVDAALAKKKAAEEKARLARLADALRGTTVTKDDVTLPVRGGAGSASPSPSPLPEVLTSPDSPLPLQLSPVVAGGIVVAVIVVIVGIALIARK